MSQDGVYDITDFIGQHPGGAKRIMLAAGGSVDSFWAMYAQHQKKEVSELLEGYRIGSLVRAPPSASICLLCGFTCGFMCSVMASPSVHVYHCGIPLEVYNSRCPTS